MFSLFRKSGRMKEEALKAKRQYGIFKTIVMMIVLMYGSQIIGAVLISIPYTIYQMGQGTKTVEDMVNGLLYGDAAMLMNLFITLATIICVICFARYYMKRNWGSLGLFKEHIFKDYGKGLLIGFVMMGGAVGIAYVLGGLDFDGWKEFSLGLLIVYFIGFMIQGFNEELLMRGFVMNSISTKYSMPLAIFLNSFIFACLHLMNSGISAFAFINLILAGVVFSLMALYYDNLYACSAAHTMWNFAQGNIFGILVSGLYLPTSVMRFYDRMGMTWLHGGSFGLEGGFAVFVIECLSIVILCYANYRKTKREENPQRSVTVE